MQTSVRLAGPAVKCWPSAATYIRRSDNVLVVFTIHRSPQTITIPSANGDRQLYFFLVDIEVPLHRSQQSTPSSAAAAAAATNRSASLVVDWSLHYCFDASTERKPEPDRSAVGRTRVAHRQSRHSTVGPHTWTPIIYRVVQKNGTPILFLR